MLNLLPVEGLSPVINDYCEKLAKLAESLPSTHDQGQCEIAIYGLQMRIKLELQEQYIQGVRKGEESIMAIARGIRNPVRSA